MRLTHLTCLAVAAAALLATVPAAPVSADIVVRNHARAGNVETYEEVVDGRVTKVTKTYNPPNPRPVEEVRDTRDANGDGTVITTKYDPQGRETQVTNEHFRGGVQVGGQRQSWTYRDERDREGRQKDEHWKDGEWRPGIVPRAEVSSDRRGGLVVAGRERFDFGIRETAPGTGIGGYFPAGYPAIASTCGGSRDLIPGLAVIPGGRRTVARPPDPRESRPSRRRECPGTAGQPAPAETPASAGSPPAEPGATWLGEGPSVPPAYAFPAAAVAASGRPAVAPPPALGVADTYPGAPRFGTATLGAPGAGLPARPVYGVPVLPARPVYGSPLSPGMPLRTGSPFLGRAALTLPAGSAVRGTAPSAVLPGR